MPSTFPRTAVGDYLVIPLSVLNLPPVPLYVLDLQNSPSAGMHDIAIENVPRFFRPQAVVEVLQALGDYASAQAGESRERRATPGGRMDAVFTRAAQKASDSSSTSSESSDASSSEQEAERREIDNLRLSDQQPQHAAQHWSVGEQRGGRSAAATVSDRILDGIRLYSASGRCLYFDGERAQDSAALRGKKGARSPRASTSAPGPAEGRAGWSPIPGIEPVSKFTTLLKMYTDAYLLDASLPEDVLVSASEAFLQKYEDKLAASKAPRVTEEGWTSVLPGMVSRPAQVQRRGASRISRVDEDEGERKVREFAQRYREEGFYAVQVHRRAREQLRELRRQMQAEEEVLRGLRESGVLNPFKFKL